MAIRCRNCPLRPKPLFQDFSGPELQFMESFKVGEMVVDAGTPILSEGSNAPQLYTVLEGMGLRYKMLSNGDRQILSFVFPGDLAGLQAGVMGVNGYSLEATTKMRLCVFNRRDLWNLFRNQPERAYDLTWAAALEQHFLGETIASLGQRTAMERIAWAMVKVYRRLQALDIGGKGWVPLPYTQRDLADALGLSLVHTNKTLRKIAEHQYATWSEGRLSISNLDALADLAMVDLEEGTKRPLL